jgi:hypothetical protein
MRRREFITLRERGLVAACRNADSVIGAVKGGHQTLALLH